MIVDSPLGLAAGELAVLDHALAHLGSRWTMKGGPGGAMADITPLGAQRILRAYLYETPEDVETEIPWRLQAADLLAVLRMRYPEEA